MNATSTVLQPIVQQTLTTLAGTIYTVPANNAVKVASATVCNTSAAPVMIYLYVNGTAAANTIVANYYVDAYDTVSLSEILGGLHLDEGDTIGAYAASNSVVSILITGAILSV